MRVTAVGRELIFNVRGGYASVEEMLLPPGVSERGAASEAHGIIVPVSPKELGLHAAKEGGYDLKTILVRPYGSSLELEVLAFVSSWWRRVPKNQKPSQSYLDLIRCGARERGLSSAYCAMLDSLTPASLADRARQQAVLTPNDLVGRAVVAGAASALLALYLTWP